MKDLNIKSHQISDSDAANTIIDLKTYLKLWIAILTIATIAILYVDIYWSRIPTLCGK